MSITETSASELASFLLETHPVTPKPVQKKKKKQTNTTRKAVKEVIKQVNAVSLDDDFFNSIYEPSSEETPVAKAPSSKKSRKAAKPPKNNDKAEVLSNETLTEAEAFDQLDDIKIDKKEKKHKKEKKAKTQSVALPQITDSKMIQLDEDLALLSKQTLAMYSKQMDIKTKLIGEMGSSEGNLQSAFAVLHDYIESFVEYYDSICEAIDIEDESGLLAECVSKRMEIMVLSKKANKLNKEKKFMVNNSKTHTQAKRPKKNKKNAPSDKPKKSKTKD